jgi:sn-glycerol 3-phosphate transport system permease protein
MERRAFFTNHWLGIALIAPQILLIFTFFYWPAGEALFWAFTLERPWGGGNEWVGLANFTPCCLTRLLEFHLSAARSLPRKHGLGHVHGPVLALLTDRELRGSRIYRSVLVWPSLSPRRRSAWPSALFWHRGGLHGLRQQDLAGFGTRRSTASMP